MSWEDAWRDAINSGKVIVDGNADKVFEVLDLLDEFNLMFNMSRRNDTLGPTEASPDSTR